MATPTTPKPVQRRLRVVGFDGAHFGEDYIELRWRAEDGSIAQRIFKPSVWQVMPTYAERGYHAAVTAHPPTRFDVAHTAPPAPAPAAAPPAPADSGSASAPARGR